MTDSFVGVIPQRFLTQLRLIIERAPTIGGGEQVSILEVVQLSFGCFRQTKIGVGQENSGYCSSDGPESQRPEPHPEQLRVQPGPRGQHCRMRRDKDADIMKK